MWRYRSMLRILWTEYFNNENNFRKIKKGRHLHLESEERFESTRKQNEQGVFGEYDFHMTYWWQEGQQETSIPNEILQVDERTRSVNRNKHYEEQQRICSCRESWLHSSWMYTSPSRENIRIIGMKIILAKDLVEYLIHHNKILELEVSKSAKNYFQHCAQSCVSSDYYMCQRR